MNEKYSFENLDLTVQNELISKYERYNGNLEGLYWNWYDNKGNITGDMLPF